MPNEAKDDAPSEREYRALKRAAREKVEDKYSLECQFVLRLAGELGLRAGEIAHISEEWVDFDYEKIVIEGVKKCCKGRDGGPCGYCKKRAREEAKWHDDISYEKALRNRWQPKNKSSEREIYFGFDHSLVELIDEYLYKNGQYTSSRASVNRRIDKVAEACDRVDKDDVYPHALRSHAAMFHVRKGMRMYHLKEFMGWSEIDGAMPYMEMSDHDVVQELKRIHKGAAQTY